MVEEKVILVNENDEQIGLMGKQEAFMDDRYKIIRSSTDSEFELYDLINDPAESIDLMSNNPSEGKRLKASFQTWRNSVEKSMTGADYQ